MFVNASSPAKAAADSHPDTKSKKAGTELAIRNQVRSWRDAGWIDAAGADQLEDSKGESAERQQGNQKKYDFVTALHN